MMSPSLRRGASSPITASVGTPALTMTMTARGLDSDATKSSIDSLATNAPSTPCSSISARERSPAGEALSQLFERRHPIDERAQALADGEDDVHEGFLGRGVFDRAGVDGVVTAITVQLLDDLAGRLVPAPQVARPGPRLT